MKNCFILALLLAVTFPQNGWAQQFLKLEGRILVAGSGEPVPFAAIGFPDKGLGTVCDEAGNFELKIPNEYKNQPICISALGFKQTCLPAAGLQQNNQIISLEPANLELATVEIKAISAEALVKEAIRRIPENYAAKPVHYTYYQRQSRTINDRPAYIIESVNEMFRKHPKADHHSAIRKSRGMATSDKNRELMDEAWVGVYTLINYDNILDYPDHLHPKKHNNFDYQLTDENLIGKDTVYVIAFKPKLKKDGQGTPGIEGKLFLNKRSYAVIRLETRQNQAEIDQENNSMIAKTFNKACNCTVTHKGSSQQITYKQIGNRWYVSNFTGEGHSVFAGEKYPIPETSHYMQQLVVTDIQTENATEIPEEQRVKSYRNYYSKAPKDMNEAYWQQYNVLPLPDAYKNQAAQ